MYIPSLESEISQILNQEKITETSAYEIKQCFKKYGNMFGSVTSEKKRFNILRRKGLIDFEKIAIGSTFKEDLVGNQII